MTPNSNQSGMGGRLPAWLTIAFLSVLVLIGFSVLYFLNINFSNSIDYSVNQKITEIRNEQLILSFLRVTALGQADLIIPFIVLCALILYLLNRSGFIPPLILTSLCAISMSTLGKLTFERPRPLDAVIQEHSFSFPSGHATISIAFYGFVTYLLMRSTRHKYRQAIWFFLGVLLIALIGFSRIYLGVHYMSDVWTGYLIGILWLIAGIALCEWLIARRYLNVHASFSPHRRNGSWVFFAIAVTFYLVFINRWQP